MFLRRWFLRLFTLLSILVLAALMGSAPSSLATENPAPLATPVCGAIASDITWTLGASPYVITCDVTVNAGVTLTVEPGVVVKFQHSSDDLVVAGRLLAQGTEAQPIVFTSYKDDVHGGDTNGDGSGSSPAPGDWSCVGVDAASSGSVLDWVWIGYGGNPSSPYYYYASLQLYTSDVTVQHNVIASSWDKGLYVGQVDPGHPLVLTENTFVDNTGWAILQKATGTRTDITLVGNTSRGSPQNGFGITGSMEGAVTYGAPSGFPFIAWDLTVPGGSSLAFAAGTVVKVKDAASIYVDGELTTEGTEAEPVVFTSMHDDAQRGDTNGDGAATSPAPGDWSSLKVTGEAAFSGTQLLYGGLGGGVGSALRVYSGANVSFDGGAIENSWNRGIWVSDASRLIVSDSQIEHNQGEALLVDGNDAWVHVIGSSLSENGQAGAVAGGVRNNGMATVVLGGEPRAGNQIVDNAGYGAYQYGAGGAMLATYNWWGNTSGPTHASNPGGLGEEVSNGVTFDPWLGTYNWIAPFHDLLHGTEQLEWAAFGTDPDQPLTVDVVATQNGAPIPLGSGLPRSGSLAWDTAAVADGLWELRAQFRDGADQVVGEAVRQISVNNSAQVAYHGGTVGANESWAAGLVHVVEEDIFVGSGATLSLEPGAVIKFGRGLELTVGSGGVLDAPATAGSPIVLTSLADDTAGGDTNLDGALSLPLSGDWHGLAVETGGLANLSAYVELRYLLATHSGTLTASETWPLGQLHRITGDLLVPGGVTLTILEGVTVKLDDKVGITVQGGQLTVLGSVAQPVVFTSSKDDTAGGDTNGDGAATAPAAGDWHWIYLDGGTASFDHAVIAYGGGTASGNWDGTGALRTNGSASLTVDNSLIREAFFDGVLAWGGPVTIRNSVVTGADRGICAHSNSAVTIVNATVDDNRIGLLLHGGSLEVANTIVSHGLEYGILHDYGADNLTIRFSDVWTPDGTNYNGTADRTGQDGNVSADPEYQGAERGDLRLGYVSPAIDAADGTVAATTDLMGAPRYDDPRSPNTGLPTPGGVYADLGAYEFVESAPSSIDLVVSQVSGPSTAMAGEMATVSWTVVNVGAEAVVGPWHDSVALGSAEMLTPTLLVAGEALSGDGVTLGPGGSVDLEATLRVPGGVVGDYFWYVDTNTRGEVFEGQNRANNLKPSLAMVVLDVPELAVDGPALSRKFGAGGEAQWFRFQGVEGQDVQVTLDSQAGAGSVELYLGGIMPTRLEYEVRSAEWNSPDVSLIAAGTFSQTYYLLAYPEALPGGPPDFIIRASSLDFSLTSVRPTAVGNSGLVTLEIAGGRLISGTLFSLVASGGTQALALRTSAVDSSRVYATFDLTGFPAGPADVEAQVEGATATAQDAVQVQAGGAGEFYAELAGPSVLRRGRSGTWYVTYGNRGLVDVPLPLLKFTVPGAQEMVLFEYEGSWAESVVLLALNRDALLPTLGPGQEATVAVEVLPGGSNNTVEARLDCLSGEAAAQDTTPFGWDSIPMPPGVDPAAWQAELDSLDERLGETVGEYYRVLMEDLGDLAAHRLPYAYVANANGRWLFGPELSPGPAIVRSAQAEGQAGSVAMSEAWSAPNPRTLAGDGIRRTYQVIIADADYAQADPSGQKNLTMVDKDYDDVAQMVSQELRTPDSQVVTLHDRIGRDDDTLTKDVVLAQIESLRGRLDGDDNLVVWFSGHGKSDAGGTYLRLNAADEQGKVYAADLQQAFDQVGAGQTYLIADSCNSGGMDQIQCTNTAVVGLFATTRDRYAQGYPGSGGLFFSELKAGLRNGKTLQLAFEAADKTITDDWQNAEDPLRRQDPQLYNPDGVNLRGRPWEDPTGFAQRLNQIISTIYAPNWAELLSPIIVSSDPNDKIGPAGSGAPGYVGFDPLLAYTVHFENQATATAPAQRVIVSDALDANLDLSTLHLASIGFNDVVLDVPPGLDHYEAVAQVGSDPNPVHVAATLDYDTRTVTWTLWSVDPATGDLPEDPYAGFLPPNDAEHHGEGYVSFTLRPAPGLMQGTEIHNQATIVFDVNPPISTNVVLNTIGVGEVSHNVYLPLVPRRP